MYINSTLIPYKEVTSNINLKDFAELIWDYKQKHRHF